jgi:hypothetical protein
MFCKEEVTQWLTYFLYSSLPRARLVLRSLALFLAFLKHQHQNGRPRTREKPPSTMQNIAVSPLPSLDLLPARL